MKTYVVDDTALRSYFSREHGWQSVSQTFHEAVEGRSNVLTTATDVGEVYASAYLQFGEEKARAVLEAMNHLPIEIVAFTKDLAVSAARLKVGAGVSGSSCAAAALAKAKRAQLLTAERSMKALDDEVKVNFI